MRISTALCLLLLGATAPAPAHHSTANFDMQKSATVAGTVSYFSFTNPHSFFDLDVKDKAGKIHHYKVFTLARVVMMRNEWTTGDLKAGDQVTVTGHPDRGNAEYLYLQTIVFASGRKWDRSRVN